MKRTHKGKGKVQHDSGGSDDDNAMEKTFTKGPWAQAEDNLLIAYVEKHGEGNWNAVQKNSTLSRCGKSCRLRWVNHLRPNLKKGAFSDKEEQRVVELHAVMGNKWAQMAAELHGRTDNEIKNFWNTRLKRLKRLGLPVYPDEVREKAMNAAAHSGLNTDHSLDADTSQDSLEVKIDEMPVPDFKFLHTSPSPSYYQSMFPTTGSFLRQRQIQPNMYNSIASSSGTAFPFTSGGSMNPNMYTSIASSSGTAFPFTSGGSMNEQSLPLENYPFVESTLEHVPPDIYLHDNATSPSEPLIHRIEKFEELPSFQCFDSHEEPGTWEALQFDPIPELESLFQPPLTDQTPSNWPSSLFDGLLESIDYGSSGERRATETDSESPLVMSSLLGHAELPPSTSNTTGQNFNFETDLGYFGSTSSEERHIYFDADWISQCFGEDTNNTK